MARATEPARDIGAAATGATSSGPSEARWLRVGDAEPVSIADVRAPALGAASGAELVSATWPGEPAVSTSRSASFARSVDETRS